VSIREAGDRRRPPALPPGDSSVRPPLRITIGRDLHLITNPPRRSTGVILAGLAVVDPRVRFGFGSVSRAPALVRVTTTVAGPAPVPPIQHPDKS
jgi:hypothetical protein